MVQPQSNGMFLSIGQLRGADVEHAIMALYNKSCGERKANRPTFLLFRSLFLGKPKQKQTFHYSVKYEFLSTGKNKTKL